MQGSGVSPIIFKEIARFPFSLTDWYTIFLMIVKSLYFLEFPYSFAILCRSGETVCDNIYRSVHVLPAFWRKTILQALPHFNIEHYHSLLYGTTPLFRRNSLSSL